MQIKLLVSAGLATTSLCAKKLIILNRIANVKLQYVKPFICVNKSNTCVRTN